MNQLPAALVLVVDEKPHDVFSRDTNALMMTSQCITVAEAVGVMTMVLTMLDCPTLSISNTCIVSHGYEHAVEGVGIQVQHAYLDRVTVQFSVSHT